MTTTQLSGEALAWMGAYLGLVIVVSNVFARRIQTVFDFFLAGRRLTAWPVALSFVAAWFGAGSSMTGVNTVFQHGLSGAWEIVIPAILSCVVITYFLARRVAAQETLSMPEAMERAYGPTARLLLACILLPYGATFIGSEMIAARRLLGLTTGLEPFWAVLGVAATVTAYSALGGFFSVVLTDVMQFALFSTAVLGVAGFTLWQALQQPQTWQMAAIAVPPSFWDVGHDGVKNVFLTLAFVLGWSIAPEMWQRMSALRHPQQAFRAARLATVCLLGLYALVVAIGLAALGRVPTGDDTVFVRLAFQLPHPALTTFVLVGLIAAITSTIDSTVNVGALTLTQDLYHRFLRRAASNRELLWASRLFIVLVFIPAGVIALRFENMVEVFWLSADVFATTMFWPIMGLLFMRQPSPKGAVWAMALGASVSLANAVISYQWLPVSVPWWPGAPYTTTLGLFLSGIGFWCAGGWLQNTARPKGA
jgi:SSS family solute:Na+ symporter